MKLNENELSSLYLASIAEANKSVPEDKRKHPKVGAILASESGKILLKTHRGEEPGCHAEARLFEKARQKNIDLTKCYLFVTLEPCIARGRGTTPCAILVAESGIKHVFIGTLDPNPSITGRGETFLTYHGLHVHRYPDCMAEKIRKINHDFFDRFRSAHFYSKSPATMYGESVANGDKARALLSNSRDLLLYQSMDVILGTCGNISICAGDLSWLRELQVCLIDAALRKRKVRILSCQPRLGKNTESLIRIASQLGADVIHASTRQRARFTLVENNKNEKCIFNENIYAELYNKGTDQGILSIISAWFESQWKEGSILRGQSPVIREILEVDVLNALRAHVPQYADLDISVAKVPVDELHPATNFLEKFKLFRINQFDALRASHKFPKFVRVGNSPWPLIALPVVERFPDSTLVLVDGTHRAYAARSRGIKEIEAIVVNNVNYDFPCKYAQAWDKVELCSSKFDRKKRYDAYNEKLFRPIRAAYSTLVKTNNASK